MVLLLLFRSIVILPLLLLLLLQGINTVTDMARSPSLPYAALFDMPLTYYFMWIYPKTRKCSTCPYRETYDLASYLLQR